MSNAETLASDPVNLHQLLSADNELQCPLFQRPYVWTKKNIDQLWADVDTIREEEFDARFLGALVFDNEYASTARKAGLYWIIDGQQRLTTLFLSLVALCEVAVEAGDAHLAHEIADQYLLSRKSNNAGMPKLRPTLNDSRQFNRIILTALAGQAKVNTAHEQGPAEGNMRSAYELILRHVRSRCIDSDGSADSALVQLQREKVSGTIPDTKTGVGLMRMRGMHRWPECWPDCQDFAHGTPSSGKKYQGQFLTPRRASG